MELLCILLFGYMRRLRDQKLRQAAEAAATKAKEVLPLETVIQRAKQSMPAIMK